MAKPTPTTKPAMVVAPSLEELMAKVEADEKQLTVDQQAANDAKKAQKNLTLEQQEAAKKQAFVNQIIEARRPQPPPPPPAPPTVRQLAQTELEMARGKEVVDRHAAIPRPVRPVDPTEGTSTPVFRPVDYVPPIPKG